MKKHPLEELLNARADDMLSAIQKGHRAIVDVKGKLAEYFLNKKLEQLKKAGVVQDFLWFDQDGVPDFSVKMRGKEFRMECKNIRSEVLFKDPTAYKVELQKTRNSKDGTNTRGYKISDFQILAACLFNHTQRWEYHFICTHELERRTTDPQFLAIMQRVPLEAQAPWSTDLVATLQHTVFGRHGRIKA